ncbi:serine protease 40-like [Perognathus longimembris pacificus]|uniref:serine protease 40-like n=1 Tax=Perognathus longimembris pacificus TaxID=214514 RepID=UPI00201857BE|nr:serine protease 40-like [Perognathus longimembris pacificus]
MCNKCSNYEKEQQLAARATYALRAQAQISPMGGAGGQHARLSGSGAWALLAVLLSLRLQWPHAHPIPPASSLSEVCGKTRFYGKIFGGQSSAPERWPWQASLLYLGRHICGAALIDRYWVASAAHCFQRSSSPSDYQILLGYNQLSNPTNYSLKKSVYKLIMHPDYDKYHRQGSDIILLQLYSPVEFNSHILPACVPSNSTKLSANRPCWISGWGMVTEDRFLPEPLQLQEAEVILIENQNCASYFQPPDPNSSGHYTVKDDVVCAWNLRQGVSICRGDSGGPLVCPLSDGTWYLVGLSSWSVACYHPIDSPSVFTRVSYFFDWIQEKKQTSGDPAPGSEPQDENAPALVGSREHNHSTGLKPSVCLLSLQVLLLQLLMLRHLR